MCQAIISPYRNSYLALVRRSLALGESSKLLMVAMEKSADKSSYKDFWLNSFKNLTKILDSMIMGQKAFISDADLALANFIWNGIKNGPAAKNMVSSQEQISFSSPKATSAHGNRKLSIFLYNITEETAKRNMSSTIDCSNKNTRVVCSALYYYAINRK